MCIERGNKMYKFIAKVKKGTAIVTYKEMDNADFLFEMKEENGLLAKLNYKQIGKTDRYWLVEVELLTGRHHQIRCQLSNLGCPIKGDLKYGSPRSNPDGGISLHARRITFTHPVRKEEMTIEAPVPLSWKGVSQQ